MAKLFHLIKEQEQQARSHIKLTNLIDQKFIYIAPSQVSLHNTLPHLTAIHPFIKIEKIARKRSSPPNNSLKTQDKNLWDIKANAYTIDGNLPLNTHSRNHR